ncbi:ECF RNA polymerase sigma factor SigJ [Gimesia panareensis]|uniref:ECF RNA polymerase sigma factor SigJ n=1 Tax=Gimesia panareensis TaxID=2527978 RepID=A0A518FQC5_9PLAN|nr:RNA polymerase sigma factor SigJ [Gimesia panareensis]QDV18552.1 ECF RNA polymerase sigma factor SigJ [Gimesia panareensis]
MTAAVLATFEAARAQLIGLAYRITGSRTEAEDIVQETCLKWLAADQAVIQVPRAWLMKVATRLSLDYLKSARVQRMSYIGPWLPEPFLANENTPEEELELDESISMALLVLLEQLSPAERASFILHDLFQYRFEEIADILDRSASACRKLASRARAKIGNQDLQPELTRDAHLQMLNAFTQAVKQGETAPLVSLLQDEATFVSDGGGKALAARKIVRGSALISRFFLKTVRPALLAAEDPDPEIVIKITWFNGAPGLIIYHAGQPVSALQFQVTHNKIQHIYVLRNPDKLRLFHTS